MNDYEGINIMTIKYTHSKNENVVNKRKQKKRKNGGNFNTNPSYMREWLKELLENTNSISQEEKKWWFDQNPTMTVEQEKRLYDILATEKRKIEELELKYKNLLSK